MPVEKTKTVTAYQLLDHGMDHAQYFQGCGIAFTAYKNVVTGCGSNFAEAIEDALDSLAQENYDTEALEKQIKEDEGITHWPTAPNTDKYAIEDEDSEMYYYVSIRVSP